MNRWVKQCVCGEASTHLLHLLTASTISAFISSVLFSSGRGVIFTPASQGNPAFSRAMRLMSLVRKASFTEEWTMTSLMAVQRWPLKEVAPMVT